MVQSRSRRRGEATGSEAKNEVRQDLKSLEEREEPAKVWKYCFEMCWWGFLSVLAG